MPDVTLCSGGCLLFPGRRPAGQRADSPGHRAPVHGEGTQQDCYGTGEHQPPLGRRDDLPGDQTHHGGRHPAHHLQGVPAPRPGRGRHV